jgi:hypothetical protein
LFDSRRNAEKKKSSEKSVVLGEEEWALAGLLHTGAAGSGVFFFSSSAFSKYVFFSGFP